MRLRPLEEHQLPVTNALLRNLRDHRTCVCANKVAQRQIQPARRISKISQCKKLHKIFNTSDKGGGKGTAIHVCPSCPIRIFQLAEIEIVHRIVGSMIINRYRWNRHRIFGSVIGWPAILYQLCCLVISCLQTLMKFFDFTISSTGELDRIFHLVFQSLIVVGTKIDEGWDLHWAAPSDVFNTCISNQGQQVVESATPREYRTGHPSITLLFHSKFQRTNHLRFYCRGNNLTDIISCSEWVKTSFSHPWT